MDHKPLQPWGWLQVSPRSTWQVFMTVRGLLLCSVHDFIRDVPRAPHLMVCTCGRCTSLLCSRGMLQALEVVAALPPSTVDRPCPPALWVRILDLVVSCQVMCTTTQTHLHQRQLCACTSLPAADLPPVLVASSQVMD